MSPSRRNGLVDRLLAPIVRRPRLLQASALLVAVWVLVDPSDPGSISNQHHTAPTTSWSAASAIALPAVDRATPEGLIAAYNAATIAAGATGEPDGLALFFTPGSPSWVAIRREYARRAAIGERHQAALVRWGILAQTVTATTATIETQELWNDTTHIVDQAVDEQRGLLQRVRYYLTRTGIDHPWQLVDVTSTAVVQ